MENIEVLRITQCNPLLFSTENIKFETLKWRFLVQIREWESKKHEICPHLILKASSICSKKCARDYVENSWKLIHTKVNLYEN